MISQEQLVNTALTPSEVGVMVDVRNLVKSYHHKTVVNNGAGFAAIQTGVLILLAWIVASLLVTWRAFRWL